MHEDTKDLRDNNTKSQKYIWVTERTCSLNYRIFDLQAIELEATIVSDDLFGQQLNFIYSAMLCLRAALTGATAMATQKKQQSEHHI